MRFKNPVLWKDTGIVLDKWKRNVTLLLVGIEALDGLEGRVVPEDLVSPVLVSHVLDHSLRLMGGVGKLGLRLCGLNRSVPLGGCRTENFNDMPISHGFTVAHQLSYTVSTSTMNSSHFLTIPTVHMPS